MNDAGARHAYPPRVRFEIAEGDARVLPARRRLPERQRRRRRVRAARVRHLRRQGRRARARAPARAAHADRHDAAHDPRASPDPVQRAVMDELVGPVGAARRHERRRRRAAARRPRRRPREDRRHPARHSRRCPTAAARTSSASRASSVILTFGLLSPDKGIEHVIDALPAILERHPNTVYIVLGATHPHVKEQHGETYRLMLQTARRAARRRRQRDLPQPLRQPRGARRVPRRGRHLRHAVPQGGADHLGHAGLRGRLRQGGHLDARIATRASCSPTGAASSCRGATPRRSPARSSGSSTTPRSAPSCSSARPRSGASMGWPLVARRYVESFEQARAEHAERCRTESARRGRSRGAGPSCRRSNLEHVRLHDRRHRHAAARRFSVPRYGDGYCLDDNARALLLHDARRGGRHRGRPRPCARSRRATSPSSSHAFDEDERAVPELHVATRGAGSTSAGSEDSHGRALWALGHGRRPLRRSRAAEPRRAASSTRALPAAPGFTSPRAWAFALLGIDEYLRAFQGDSSVQAAAGRRSRSGCSSSSSSAEPPGLALVRGPPHLLQRAPAAGAARVRVRGCGDEEMTAVGAALARVAASIQHVGADGTSRRSARTASTCAARRRRLFDQQPVEACAMVSACLEAHRRDRRRALAGAGARRASSGSSGRTRCRSRSTTRAPAAAATGSTPIA